MNLTLVIKSALALVLILSAPLSLANNKTPNCAPSLSPSIKSYKLKNKAFYQEMAGSYTQIKKLVTGYPYKIDHRQILNSELKVFRFVEMVLEDFDEVNVTLLKIQKDFSRDHYFHQAIERTLDSLSYTQNNKLTILQSIKEFRHKRLKDLFANKVPPGHYEFIRKINGMLSHLRGHVTELVIALESPRVTATNAKLHEWAKDHGISWEQLTHICIQLRLNDCDSVYEIEIDFIQTFKNRYIFGEVKTSRKFARHKNRGSARQIKKKLLKSVRHHMNVFNLVNQLLPPNKQIEFHYFFVHGINQGTAQELTQMGAKIRTH